IVNWARTADLRRRLAELEEASRQQEATIAALTKRLRDAAPVAPPPTTAEARPVRAEPSAAAPAPAAPPKSPVPQALPPVVVGRERAADVPARPPVKPPSSPPPPSPPPPPRQPFDWERVVGVKMFSAVAGVALVLAAVFFLPYSIDHGWLAPPIRVAIGTITGIG